MRRIVIISSSVRKGRKSHRVAMFLKDFLGQNHSADAEIIDLQEYNFPLFPERFKYLENPPENAIQFSENIRNADGVIIVTPEYNGGYPAALKNAVDLLYDEWHRKPVAIVTVSDGNFGGMQVITSLQFVLWKMRALVIPAMMPVPNVDKSFSPDGTCNNPDIEKRLAQFVSELIWYIEKLKS